VTNSNQLLRTWAAFGTLAVTAFGLASACGSSDNLTCGSGTQKHGTQCIVAASTGGSGGDSSSGGTSDTGGTDAGALVPGPVFAGVITAAPATDVAVQVTWAPATDALTDSKDILYNVYVATTAGGENFGTPTLVSPPGVSSVLVGGLTPDTLYYFVVRAQDSAGLMDMNSVETSTTPMLDTAAPVFAGATEAKSVGDNSVEVSWDAATDDLTPPAGIAYTITWSTSAKAAPDGTLGLLTQPGVTSAVVSNLPNPSSKYYFTVRARDAAGNTDDNTVAVGGSTTKDQTPPAFSGCTAAADPGATTATLTWDPAKDDTTIPDEITYNVYAFTDPVDSTTLFGNPVGTFKGGTTGTVDGLKSKTTYYFVCRAEDASSNEDQNLGFRTTTTLVDSTPPTFGGISSTVVGSTTVTLKWDAATDDKTDPSQIVYLVYSSTDSTTIEKQKDPIATSDPGANSIQVSDLKSATQYYFLVRARDKALNADANTQVAPVQTLVSFNYDVQPILSTYCAKAGCHVPGNPPQGLIMAAGFAYTYLVGQNAVEAPWMKRIDPTGTGADGTDTAPLAKSYLINKITAVADKIQACQTPANPPCVPPGYNPPVGSPVMPPIGNTRPPEESRNIVIQWNREGAQNN
jgi:hypothetical protein